MCGVKNSFIRFIFSPFNWAFIKYCIKKMQDEDWLEFLWSYIKHTIKGRLNVANSWIMLTVTSYTFT